jgi:hypothetical protein
MSLIFSYRITAITSAFSVGEAFCFDFIQSLPALTRPPPQDFLDFSPSLPSLPDVLLSILAMLPWPSPLSDMLIPSSTPPPSQVSYIPWHLSHFFSNLLGASTTA